jgi:hypothetical protein
MEAWLGFGATQSYYGTWVGGVVALNPQHNVWDSGFVLRGEATIGRYDVDNNPFQDNVLTHGASWMFGYRQKIGDGLLTGYIGANYEDHDNDQVRPDPRAGSRLQSPRRILYPDHANLGFLWTGSYSTAFDGLPVRALRLPAVEHDLARPGDCLLPKRVRLQREPLGRIHQV